MEPTPFAKTRDNKDTESFPSSSNHLALPQLLPPRGRFRRYFAYRFFGVYQRLFLAVLLINVFYAHHIVTMKRRSKYSPLLVDITTAVSANMLVAILIRQDYILNSLFWLCWSAPPTTPLWIRISLARVYEFGGLHSSTTLCSALWFCFLFAILTVEFMTFRIADPLIILCAFFILAILWLMIITACPLFRSRKHNVFENIHRYGGWTILGLFWILLHLFTRALTHQAGPQSPGAVLTELPAFWLLLACCFHVVLPWVRFRRLWIQPERLGVGVHAVRLHLNEKIENCVVYRISDSPLTEWHSFACIPNHYGEGGSLIVSNAGDWTRRTINRPEKVYYTRGIPTVGVLCMAQIFRKVVIVTTGSGIGPCLGAMMNIPSTKCRVLWSASSPKRTFGNEIWDKVQDVDSQAVVIDTHIQGHKDLVAMAYALYTEEEAEAIFCVSNKKLTRSMVYELESRGIPTFGPIWDS
jgi:hypothetical protein